MRPLLCTLLLLSLAALPVSGADPALGIAVDPAPGGRPGRVHRCLRRHIHLLRDSGRGGPHAPAGSGGGNRAAAWAVGSRGFRRVRRWRPQGRHRGAVSGRADWRCGPLPRQPDDPPGAGTDWTGCALSLGAGGLLDYWSVSDLGDQITLGIRGGVILAVPLGGRLALENAALVAVGGRALHESGPAAGCGGRGHCGPGASEWRSDLDPELGADAGAAALAEPAPGHQRAAAGGTPADRQRAAAVGTEQRVAFGPRPAAGTADRGSLQRLHPGGDHRLHRITAAGACRGRGSCGRRGVGTGRSGTRGDRSRS